MSSLNDLIFTDIILDKGSNTNWLKGVPGHGEALVPLESLCPSLDIKLLEEALATQMLAHKEMFVIRFKFEGIYFRASYAPSHDISPIEPLARPEVAEEGNSPSPMCWFLRRLPEKVPSLSEIAPPAHITAYLTSEKAHGLILIAGEQGAGKTTLASSIVKTRLMMYGGHCVTFESPAEMPLRGPHGTAGLCIQTEMDREEDLPQAVRRAHTFAQPDSIYIGEIKTAVAAAETLRAALGSKNQLVIATIHGQDMVSAIQRLLIWGKEIDGDNAAVNLSTTLTAIFHLSLDTVKEKKQIVFNETLLVPFGGDFCTKVRAKIKNHESDSLGNEVKSLKGILFGLGGDITPFIDWGKTS